MPASSPCMAAARSCPASSALRARSAPCSADRETNAASIMGVPHQQPDNLRRKHSGLPPGGVTAPAPVRRRLTTDCRVGDVLHPAISSHARAMSRAPPVGISDKASRACPTGVAWQVLHTESNGDGQYGLTGRSRRESMIATLLASSPYPVHVL